MVLDAYAPRDADRARRRGKTRFALHAAADEREAFPTGVLSRWRPCATPSSSLAALARRLVRGAAGRDISATGEVLLVLDNLEQVLPVAAVLGAQLAPSPRSSCSGTSREALRSRASGSTGATRPSDEAVTTLPAARRGDGGRLDRRRPPQSARRLDGLPFAIESRRRGRAYCLPSELLERLYRGRSSRSRASRRRSAPARTLRATIEWSYDLLEPHEQGPSRRLAVFAGGCTLEAAELVQADLDELESLSTRACSGARAGEPVLDARDDP